MKKLLAIVVLGLLFSGNAYALDIKVKRIECTFFIKRDGVTEKFYNKFFIISDNQKTAKLYRSVGWYGWETIDLKVRANLHYITFEKKSSLLDKGPSEGMYTIDRGSGDFYGFGDDERNNVGSCFKMEDQFDPEKFFSERVTKHFKDKKKSNKF